MGIEPHGSETGFEEADLNNCAYVEAYHLPKFTVCVECFDEEAGPELEEKKAVSFMFDMTVQRVAKASCETN